MSQVEAERDSLLVRRDARVAELEQQLIEAAQKARSDMDSAQQHAATAGAALQKQMTATREELQQQLAAAREESQRHQVHICDLVRRVGCPVVRG